MKYLACLLLVVSVTVMQAQDTSRVLSNFAKGEETWQRACVSMKAKEYKSAIEDFTKTLSLVPFFDGDQLVLKGDVYYVLSQCELAIGDTVTGCQYMGEAVKELHFKARLQYSWMCGKNPATDSAYIIRGLSHGVHHLSVADYDTAIMLNPNNAWAYYQRGGQWVDVKNYDDAISDFNKVITLQPDDYHGYYLKGMVRFKQSNFKDAAACFSDAMKKDTSYKKLHFYRGVSYYNIKEYKAAIADFEIWEKEIFGRNLGSIYNLHADCLMGLKDKKQACEYYDKAIALGYEVKEEDLKKCK